MSNKKNIFIFIIGLFLILSVFLGSYLWGVKKFNTDVAEEKDNNVIYQANDNAYLDSDGKIILKARDTLKGEISMVETLTLSQIKDKVKSLDKKDIVDFYSKEGYTLYSFDKKEVIFIKDVEPKFEIDKYYLGIENGYLAVFKCNKDGKLFIEDKTKDITEKSIDSLPKADQLLFQNYELKFNTKEEAYDQLAELES